MTKKQKEILSFIEGFLEANRYSPSYREIMQHFSFSSVGTVYKHIDRMRKKGLLQGEKKAARSLTLPKEMQEKKQRSEIELPFIGQIVAGKPIEMFAHSKTLSVPECLVHDAESTYVLRAKGDSLNEELIAEGDFLLVEARHIAQPGETVVALINEQDTIVKRFHPDGDYIRLAGNNPHLLPIILRPKDIEIQGVLVGLLRIF